MSRRRVHPIIRQIIDRDCHVSMSNRSVIRHVIGKLRNGYRTFREMKRKERRRFIEECIEVHRANVELYGSVMTGRVGSLRKRGKRQIDPSSGRLSGRDLVSLMRHHGWTIVGLAFRLGVTQKRIRQVRRSGLNDPLAVRDWYEAITGSDPGPIPERYVINSVYEECQCHWCGYPLGHGDAAFDYVGDIFCSPNCCRLSRGWTLTKSV